MKPLRRRLGDALKAGLDLVVFAAFSVLPVGFSSAIGGRIARLRGPTHYKVGHARAAANLRRLRPELTDAEVTTIGLDRWENIGRTLAEYAILHRLIPEGRVRIEGEAHLQSVQAQGMGFVLLGVHLANWEVWSPVLTHLGTRPTSFYEPQESVSRDHLARTVRRRLGVTLLPPGLAGLKPGLDALRGGQGVAVFADEVRKGLVQGPFLGRPSHTRGNLGLAVRLARQAGAPILPGYIVREPGVRFRAVILPPILLEEEARPGGRLRDDVVQLNGALEPAVRRHLDQWYYLHFKL